MTVQDLIELLEQFDPTAMVVIARDPEGNAFAPVEDSEEGFFNTRSAEFFEENEFFKNDSDYAEDTYEEDDTSAHGVPAVVIWPSY